MKALTTTFQFPYWKARKFIKIAGYSHLNASTGSEKTTWICRLAILPPCLNKLWISFKWKQRQPAFSEKKKCLAICPETKVMEQLVGSFTLLFCCLHQTMLEFQRENGPKRFLVLTPSLQMPITQLSFEISLISFFSFERWMSYLYFKVQSTIQCCQIRIWKEKSRRADCTADPVPTSSSLTPCPWSFVLFLLSLLCLFTCPVLSPLYLVCLFIMQLSCLSFSIFYVYLQFSWVFTSPHSS